MSVTYLHLFQEKKSGIGSYLDKVASQVTLISRHNCNILITYFINTSDIYFIELVN